MPIGRSILDNEMTASLWLLCSFSEPPKRNYFFFIRNVHPTPLILPPFFSVPFSPPNYSVDETILPRMVSVGKWRCLFALEECCCESCALLYSVCGSCEFIFQFLLIPFSLLTFFFLLPQSRLYNINLAVCTSRIVKDIKDREREKNKRLGVRKRERDELTYKRLYFWILRSRMPSQRTGLAQFSIEM